MNVNVSKENSNVTITVEGRLDTATAPTLDDTIKQNTADCKALVLDFAKLEYISSAGLRVLLSAQKSMTAQEGKLTVKNINDVIAEVFDITGFADIITVE